MFSRWGWYFKQDGRFSKTEAFHGEGSFQAQLSKENFNQGIFNRAVAGNSFYLSYLLFGDSILNVEILERGNCFFMIFNVVGMFCRFHSTKEDNSLWRIFLKRTFPSPKIFVQENFQKGGFSA